MAPRRVRADDEEDPDEIEDEKLWVWTDDIIDEPPDPKSRKPYAIEHKSVRNGRSEYRVGDVVQLEAETAYQWIGLIRGFETDYIHKRGQQKRAIVIWFCRQQDIPARHRLEGAGAEEIYLSHLEDSVTVCCIRRLAVVYATHQEYNAHRRKSKRKNPDLEAIYVCPKAVHARAGYFFDIDWKSVHCRADTDFDGIKEYIKQQIELRRKSRRKRKHDKDIDETYEDNDNEDTKEVHTPKKRKKQGSVSTPKRHPTSSVSTPTGPRGKKPLQITPLPMRTLSSSLLDSPYKLAQANLHVSAVPASLPCREEEYNQILEYLENAIDEGTGACIYISGVPGTGKTATVREVVRALHERVDSEELDDFHFLEINGLKVLDPNQAYAMLWEALTGERVTPLHAASLLDSQFKKAGPGRVPCVVLLDELDQLVMAKQTVLYNLFNWPTLPNSRLIVIAIANTMNLADMLPNKIQSRVGLTRVNFEPYTTVQLIQIIESRLQNVPGDIVEKDAIRLCAMRIANNTGDARKALDICRRAVEIAEASSESSLPATPSKRATNTISDAGKVTTRLLNSVLQDFLRHPIQLTLRHLPFTSKLFLAALILRSRRLSGKSEVTFGDVMEEATRICLSSVNNSEANIVMKGVTTPRGLEVAGIELDVCKIIDWEERGGRRGGRVRLQISEDDLNMAFQQDQAWKEMVR